MSVESVTPSNHLILCRPLHLMPSIFPSIRVFSNESALHIRWPKYWSFSFSISPSNEYSGLISFKTDWLDLLVVQGTLKSLLQHPQFKSINSSVLSRTCQVYNKCKVNESQYCFSSIRTTEKTERQRIDAFELWVLEKTLESPLDCKEIQPVHPKGNQS